jgi:hypothetical protein
MALELADLGRDRPPYTTELERAAEVCDSGSDLSEPPAGNYQPVGPMGDRGLNRSAIVDEKLTDSLTVFVNVAVEQAHVVMLDAVLEQVIRTSLIAQLSPKAFPLFLVYVVFVHTESRNKDGLALIVGIDVRVRQTFRLPTIFHPLATANSILIRRDRPLQMTVLPGGPSLALAR